MILKSMFIYPVKSLAGIEMKRAKMQTQGLEHDRRWMILNREGKFMTQRDDPKMALIKPALTEEFLVLNREGFSPFQLSHAEPESGALIPVKVWDDETEAFRVGKEPDEWLSDVLKQKCQLVRIPFSAVRKSTRGKHEGKRVSFADSDPVLITNETSLAELNSRLDVPVPMSRFRPNFVVEAPEAWEEDNWKSFQIGDVKFDIVKSCGRCKIITIDQRTGEKVSDDPLKTLAGYRKFTGRILFGMYGKLPEGIDNALIRVGDTFVRNSG